MAYSTPPTHGSDTLPSVDWNIVANDIIYLYGVLNGTVQQPVTILDSNTGATTGTRLNFNRNGANSLYFHFANDMIAEIVNNVSAGSVRIWAGTGSSGTTEIFGIYALNGAANVLSARADGSVSVAGTLTASAITATTGWTSSGNCVMSGSSRITFGTSGTPPFIVNNGTDLSLNVPTAGGNILCSAKLAGAAIYRSGSPQLCANASSTTIAHGLGAQPSMFGGVWATTSVVGTRAIATGFVAPTTAEVKITSVDATNITIYNNSGAGAYVTLFAML